MSRDDDDDDDDFFLMGLSFQRSQRVYVYDVC